MSYYLKRIAVLKQIGTGFSMNGKALSGLAKIEKTGNAQTISLSMINCAPVSEGEYHIVITGADKKHSCFLVGKNPSSFKDSFSFLVDIEGGFSCLVAFVHQGEASSVAFGSSGLVNASISDMTSALLKNERIVNQIYEDNKFIEPPVKLKEDDVTDTKSLFNESYQDEVVVTENYYLEKDADIKTLSIRSEQDESKDNGNAKVDAYREEKKVEREEKKTPDSNEMFTSLFKDPSLYDFDSLTKGIYFDKVKDELESIFKTHPKESALEENIPLSKWAKVYYTDDKYYTVGLIYDNRKPAYICYGVPGKYSTEPPKELKGFCSYLPMSLFDLKGEGYWMMYQNAESGECVNIDFV